MATVRRVRARGVHVPMRRPLRTSSGAVTAAPLVLIDLETSDGAVGRAYLFCSAAFALKPVASLVQSFGELIAGDELAPFGIEQKLLRSLRLVGSIGLTGMALCGIDMAAWDALAISAGLPLVRLLGGEPRPVPAYNSCGLGISDAAPAAKEAEELADGFSAVKLRLGYPSGQADQQVVRAVRDALGPDVSLMADYNRSLTVTEAILRARLLDEEGLYWIEEPVKPDDYAGNARVAAEAHTPIQIGENFWFPSDMARALEARSADYMMPDAGRIGGVSGWLRAAALADEAGMPLSSHLYPEVSAHLLCVSPTMHWLEWVDWAEPILKEPLRVENGFAQVREAPGTGLEWNEVAVEKYLA